MSTTTLSSTRASKPQNAVQIEQNVFVVVVAIAFASGGDFAGLPCISAPYAQVSPQRGSHRDRAEPPHFPADGVAVNPFDAMHGDVCAIESGGGQRPPQPAGQV